MILVGTEVAARGLDIKVYTPSTRPACSCLCLATKLKEVVERVRMLYGVAGNERVGPVVRTTYPILGDGGSNG